MASREARTRGNRRDRRKAKASEWTREGTTKPKLVAHHLSEGHGPKPKKRKYVKPLPKQPTKCVYDDGPLANGVDIGGPKGQEGNRG